MMVSAPASGEVSTGNREHPLQSRFQYHQESGTVGTDGAKAQGVVALVAFVSSRVGCSRGSCHLLTTKKEISSAFTVDGVVALKSRNGVCTGVR